MKQVGAAVIIGLTMSILQVHGGAMDDCRQCVVVTTDSWTATQGRMSLWERERAGREWTERKSDVPVVVGRGGLAWGAGLHDAVASDNMKHEGDKKAPAGIFVLRAVFGYATRCKTRMNYEQVTPDILCIDDGKSSHYNRLIDQSTVKRRDWRTAEEMRRKDDLYKWGVIVEHNARNQPGAGSCIFLHVWRGPDQPTVGCTAMAEHDIVDLIGWLDPRRAPLLVQLPRPVYQQYRERWNLPPLH